MTASCGLCERDLTQGYLCPGCALATGKRLAELPVLYAEVGECLVPRRSGWGEIVSTRGAAGPRSPIDEDVLDTVTWNGAAEVVHLWRVDVQRVRWPHHGPPPAAEMNADARWLGMELEWIAAHYPAAGDLAREVGELERSARSIVGDPAPRVQRLGTCVAVDVEGVVCGAVIKRLPGQTRIRCGWCGYTYETAQDWLQLQHLQPKEETCPSAL
ncbi:hypothetical protein [Streptomyces caniscabiei]|uniref:hypothetical protein n=1 Tax=Streptomyces caniscabiei TaxID=2746961 RepID=UPI0018726AA6|nr:hypothetical protein [Streptomyces caniscabiei]MBE4790890.1 hypothetical protein [Streptomyces caniscabiei]MDX2953317.1 hypothetical protein [Streptomyces caniscabiei]MDX2987346.1 hypothetical protein [Streptomyces caniscabiei]MDX3009517.1 hypothetical protein [Streptomyces caniscabiei]